MGQLKHAKTEEREGKKAWYQEPSIINPEWYCLTEDERLLPEEMYRALLPRQIKGIFCSEL